VQTGSPQAGKHHRGRVGWKTQTAWIVDRRVPAGSSAAGFVRGRIAEPRHDWDPAWDVEQRLLAVGGGSSGGDSC
jgi:hypothetical protein